MSTMLQTRKLTNHLAKLRNVFIDIKNIAKDIGGSGLQVLEYLSNQMQVKLVIEDEVRQNTRGSLDQGIPLPSQGSLSLEDIFHLVLTSNGLSYRLDNRVLHIFLREETAKNNLQVEIYDVSDLITTAAEEQFDYVSEENNLAEDDEYQVFGLNFKEIVDNAPELYYTESILAQLISEKVLKNRWQNFPMALVSSSYGKLFLSHLPAVHQEIHQFLDNLRQLSQLKLQLTAQFVVCKTNFFKQVELEFLPIYTNGDKGTSMLLCAQLNQEQEDKLFAAVRTSKDAAVCFHKSLNMHHLETRHISHAYRTRFVSGYNEELRCDRLGRMYEGAIVKLRPQVFTEAQELALDLDIDIATIVKPLPTLPIAMGEIAFPSQLTQHNQATIRFPYTHGLLLAGLANPYEEEGEKSFAASRKKEHLMLYWKGQVKQ